MSKQWKRQNLSIGESDGILLSCKAERKYIQLVTSTPVNNCRLLNEMAIQQKKM